MKSTHRKKKGNINKKRTKRKYTKKTYGGARSQYSEYNSQEFWDASRRQGRSTGLSRSRSRDRDDRLITLNDRLITLIEHDDQERSYQFNFEHALRQNFSDNLVKDNMTYLMLSIKNNNLYAFNRLLEYGANINIENTIGRTAFMFICFYGRLEMLQKILYDQTIDIFKPDIFGMTPMMHICYKGRVKMIEMLFEYGKNDLRFVTQVDNFGNSAIHYACSRSDKAILSTVKVLIEKSSGLNEPNAHGVTPLDFAIYKNNEAVINYLKPEASSLLEGSPEYEMVLATESKRLQVITEKNPSEFDVNDVARSVIQSFLPAPEPSVIAPPVKPPPPG